MFGTIFNYSHKSQNLIKIMWIANKNIFMQLLQLKNIFIELNFSFLIHLGIH